MFKRKVNITKFNKQKKENLQDIILIESPIDIFINSEPLVNIICLPKDLKELAFGFLYSVGIINSVEDIKDITISELENNIFVELQNIVNFKIEDIDMNPVSRVIDTTCGISSPWRKLIKNRLDEAKVKEKLWSEDTIKIKSEIIFSAIKTMQLNTPLYRETGGCHGAAIFDFEGNLLAVKEDIGRHNAIDKVIGEMLLKKYSFENVFLTSTGRLTGDSVLKAVRAKIPIVASLSAAIESGIKLAFAYGITLIGFARGARMNIYTHPERIEN
ncbi:MAG: formate dehydrogenase accessory sulfurtransferase FdhD [Candidatus Thorarchaeota archaeon]